MNTQDIREQILLEFKNVLRLAPADYTENCTNVVMSIIERHVNKARKDEHLKALIAYLDATTEDVSRQLGNKPQKVEGFAEFSIRRTAELGKK